MPKKTTGVTSASFQNFVIDSGAVYLNYGLASERLLGATKGGNTFTIETELRDMEVDGLIMSAIGQKRIINVAASMTVNLIELTAENISLALTGSAITDFLTGTVVTHSSIRRDRNLSDLDYLQNIAIVGKVQGKNENFVGILYNALASGGLEMGLEDEDESAIEVTFTAHIDADTIATDGTFDEAWEIRTPTT